MTKKIMTGIVLASLCLVSNLHAQDASRKVEPSWDVKPVKGRISQTSSGVSISISHNIQSPRDAATGQSSGKRQHQPFNFVVSAADNSVTRVKSPRDAASGLSSGKASFSDLSVMISLEKGKPKKIDVESGSFSFPPEFISGEATVIVSWSWGASNTGASSRVSKSFMVTMQEGTLSSVEVQSAPPSSR